MGMAIAFNSIPHMELANIFYNEATDSVRYVQLEENETRINGMALF
jgi:hypothetical protein